MHDGPILTPSGWWRKRPPEYKYQVRIEWGQTSNHTAENYTYEQVLELLGRQLRSDLLTDPPQRIEITRLDDE